MSEDFNTNTVEFDAGEDDADIVDAMYEQMLFDGLNPDAAFAVVMRLEYDDDSDQTLCKILEKGGLRHCLTFMVTHVKEHEGLQIGLTEMDTIEKHATPLGRMQ